MKKVYSFSAGPATLFDEVLETAQKELTNWHGSGMSVMSMSHRSKEYETIHNKATSDLKKLLNVPDNYKILFMQGGASLQFAALPMNLMGEKKTANYLVTGSWSAKAIDEAKKYMKPHLVASSKDIKFKTLPKSFDINPEGAYFHYCDNETIHGVEYTMIPEVPEGMPVICDMSSNFLSRPVDVSKFGIIYAGAQKNAGPAGVTIVIIREDLLGKQWKTTPSMLNYQIMAKNKSLYNTAPTWSIYMCGLVFDYLLRNGGVEKMHDLALHKSGSLYEYMDKSNGFYRGLADPVDRSRINIPFALPSKELEKKFQAEAKNAGLRDLGGHRSIGGLRASIYNGVTPEATKALLDFMKKFQAENQQAAKL